MFTGFTQKSSDFFWELNFNNERPWFLEHKEQFEELINKPFKELAKDTFELMEQRFPDLDLRLHISRIYRDARRLFGRGPYKDHLWFSIKGCDGLLEGPTFWFEIGAADYSYGMGFYSATAAHMEAFRRMIDANPARFERIAIAIDKNKSFKISGEEYRRPKGDHGELINKWYNRKRLGVECSFDFGGDALSERLPYIIVDCYEQLMPLYKYFIEFYNVVEREEGR